MLTIEFVLHACERALERSLPEIINSDQGSHFTSHRYTDMFLNRGVQISMDHKGRAFDNIFIERLWRTIKYENIYLEEYESPRAARFDLSRYADYYNRERPHSGLAYETPEAIYLRR